MAAFVLCGTQVRAAMTSPSPSSLLQLCIEAAPALIVACDREMVVIAASRRYREAHRVAAEAILGRSIYDVFPHITERWREMHRRCLSGIEVRIEGERFPRPDGGMGLWNWTLSPWRDDGGSVGGIVGVFEEVSERTEQQNELRRYADGLEGSHVGIAIADAATNAIQYANPAFCAQHGIASSHARGMPIMDTYPPAERDRARTIFDTADATGKVVFETHKLRGDGTTFPALVAISSPEGRSYRIGTVTDISGLKRAEAAQQVAEADLAAWVQLGPGVLCRKRVRRDGMDVLELHGDLARLGGTGDAADGRALVMAVLQSPETIVMLHRLSDAPGVQTGSADIMVSRPGAPERWIRNALRVIGRDAEAVDLIGYLTDVTKEIAEQRLLQRSATLITLGEMATSMAHELKQPLASISFAAQNVAFLAQQGQASAETLGQKLKKIVTETDRANRLIEHMRVFGRNEQRELEPVPWQRALRDALELLAPRLKDARIENLLPPDLPAVRGSPILMEQVLMNLIGNALDAYDAAPQQARTVTISGGVEDGVVAIRVADQAGGIPAEALARVFEPFFTTKPDSKGTGLGLAVCFGTVMEMGGTLTAVNANGGAVFEIRAPAAEKVSP